MGSDDELRELKARVIALEARVSHLEQMVDVLTGGEETAPDPPKPKPAPPQEEKAMSEAARAAVDAVDCAHLPKGLCAACVEDLLDAVVAAETGQVERLRGERDYWKGIAQSLLADPAAPR